MKTNSKVSKRIISLVLTILLVLSMVPMSVFSAFAEEVSELAEGLPELSAAIDTGAEVALSDADGDGYYDISTANELYAFSALVNGGNSSLNAELTADIVVNEGVMTAESTDARAWTPIGNNDYSYTGTFNGNDHTVSGLYFNSSEAYYVGLFGYIGENGAVKNTGVINSYFNGYYYVGGVVGIDNRGTITNCYNTGEVSGFYEVGGVVGMNYGTITNCYNTGFVSGAYDVGGVVGYNYYGTITNCYNTGFVSGDSYYVGGVAGDNYYGTITNCYNTGEVSGVYYIGGVAGDSYYGTITNCYYLDTAYTGGIGLNNSPAADDVAGSAEAKTAEQFKSGEVAYHLGDAFGQKIGTDELPTLGGDKVYYGYITCDEDDNTIGYTNLVTSEETKPDHNFVNGFCTDCDVFEPATLNEDGVYEIGNAGQLYWFADKVNNDNANFGSANAILTADIVVNEGVMTSESTDARVWTPIGNFNSKYSGSFDGNNKTVSGLYLNESSKWYVGLFGFVYNGTVKNTGVINSYFCGRSDVGAIAGACNSGEIINCYNESIVVGDSYTGGVVGYNEDSTMTDCYNSGNVSGNYRIAGVVGFNQRSIISNTYNTGVIGNGECVGGIVGESDEGAIESCYNAGEIIGRDTYRVGGIIGQNRDGSVDNCYNIGTVDGTDSMFVGGIAGNNIGGTITNCYYLNTACEGGIDGSDLAGSAEAKTAEQFKSGEVAYLLQGEQEELVWGQKIGTDELPTIGGDKVYYGYASCAYDSEMVYTNADVSDVRPAHKEFRAEFTWDKPYDGECYVSVEFYCADCGGYVDYASGYATLKEKVEAEDCMHPGSELYEVTFEYEGVTYTDTKEFCVKSDNHTGEFVNGFCTDCGGFESPYYNEETGIYEISNAGQLYWFAELAANDQYAKAVLTDDIIVNEDMSAENLREWIAIGESSSMPYCGTFDGQGHFISGLYAKSELNYIGLFGAIGWGAEISNLGIKDSCFEGNYYVGGIVGYNDFSYIKNCYAENVEIIAESSGGALVGYNYGEVSNSYSTSGIIADTNYGTITNCYYLADVETEDGGKTAEQFNSGEVAYLLQSGVVGEEIWDDELGEYVQTEPEHIWGQKIGTDTYPVFGGDKVYRVENCIGELVYSNANENGKHNFVNGFCTLCGGFEPATLNEDGVYEIGNAGQLYWFADKVNNDYENFGSANAILTADIVVNEGVMTSESTDARAWTPIGNYNNKYTGTFDGQNHTVSGLYFNNSKTNYVGLFGCTGENGAVKNTGVINSYFKGLSAVGGVVGSNNGTITNCYNTGEVSGTYNIGGVVGRNPAGTITSCYNTGIIEGNEFIGGVAGYNDGGTITNCYNTSEVSGSYEVGGVAGKNFEGLISNCYNIGKVSGANDYIGGVAGANQTGTITNCYYLDTAYAGGIGMNDTTKAEDIVGSAEAKTADQFKSGEVAYLLGDAFGQKIGTDELPVLGGDKVYTVINCKDEVVGYSNTEGEILDHNFEDGFCTICGDIDGIAQVKGYSISLGGNIAVNYYIVLSDEVLADENAEMVFTVPSGGSTYEVRIPVSSVTPDANGYYVFTCEVAAKEMTSKIAAQIVTGDKESDVFEYSVKQYAEYILAKAEEANNLVGGGVAGGIAGGAGASNLLSPEMLSYVKAAPLVKAMLNYGANAQLYFNHNTDILANATLDEADKALVDNLDLSEYNMSVTGSEEGVVFYGGALSLKSETAIKLYFVIEEGTAIPEVTVNGKAYELTKNGTLYELKISDIPAHMLSEMYEIKVGGLTISYGAYSYGYQAINTGKEELVNTIKALYAYNQKALEYLG